jgi:hypothetical protein
MLTFNYLKLYAGAYLDRGHGSRCPERHIFKDLEGRTIFISYFTQ